MIRASRNNQSAALTPDLTPLLDIIFIVMVFLLLTASVKLESLDVSLPTADSTQTQALEQKTLTINILDTEPFWAINGNEYIYWANFEQALLEKVNQNPKTQVIIAADKQAQIQNMVKLLSLLQQQNIEATQLLTQPN